jgi:hypothetical protein
MVRVKMKTCIAGPRYSCPAGGILVLESAAEAKALVDAGVATVVPGQVPPGVLIESAAIVPSESATMPPPIRKVGQRGG